MAQLQQRLQSEGDAALVPGAVLVSGAAPAHRILVTVDADPPLSDRHAELLFFTVRAGAAAGGKLALGVAAGETLLAAQIVDTGRRWFTLLQSDVTLESAGAVHIRVAFDFVTVRLFADGRVAHIIPALVLWRTRKVRVAEVQAVEFVVTVKAADRALGFHANPGLFAAGLSNGAVLIAGAVCGLIFEIDPADATRAEQCVAMTEVACATGRVLCTDDGCAAALVAHLLVLPVATHVVARAVYVVETYIFHTELRARWAGARLGTVLVDTLTAGEHLVLAGGQDARVCPDTLAVIAAGRVGDTLVQLAHLATLTILVGKTAGYFAQIFLRVAQELLGTARPVVCTADLADTVLAEAVRGGTVGIT